MNISLILSIAYCLTNSIIGDYSVQGELPKELEINPVEEIYPEKIIGSRIITQGGVSVPQSLIQWKNKSSDDVTWEDDAFIKGQFPDFSLEDKAVAKEGGIDRNLSKEVDLEMNNNRPKIWRVYKRKRGKALKDAELAEA